MNSAILFEMPLAKRQKPLNPDNQRQAAMRSVYESSPPEYDISPETAMVHTLINQVILSSIEAPRRNLEPAVRTTSGVE